MVKIIYYRFKVKQEEHFDTLHEAMKTSFYWWVDGSAVGYEIIDGDENYDIFDIQQYWKDHGWIC